MSGHVLEVDRLTKVYRSFRQPDVTAVDGVSLRVGKGEVVGLLGANGAGKTTTIKCICNLIRPTAGRVVINGADTRTSPDSVYLDIAAVLEGNRNIYWRLTPRENLEFFAGLQGIPTRHARREISHLLDRFGLERKVNTPARQLSRGMQQKLALACALIRGTELLILDEPTLGLDVKTSHELRSSLREAGSYGGRTILLSSHDMQVVQSLCDRVVIVHQGRVVADERVPRLLELFRPRAYHVELEGGLSEEQQEQLGREFQGARCQSQGDHVRVEVDARDSARLYDLMRLLHCFDVVVRSIDRREPSLEEVFLSITEGKPTERVN